MSEQIRAGQAHLIVFALVNSSGVAVAGLGTAFTLTISKNGGAFAASTGTKAEISGGWYSYLLTASETDTVGPLAVKVTGAGAVQKNLTFDVSWAAWAAPAGTYILTATEASDVLRCAIDDPVMLALLPGIDAYIEGKTGRDWAADSPIRQEAKSVARILLVLWHENTMMSSSEQAVLHGGLMDCLMLLKSLVGSEEITGVPDFPLKLVRTNIGPEMAIDCSIMLMFNHQMAAGATADVTLEGAGGSVAVTNSLDVTAKILTINPDANLSKATTYTVSIDHAEDIYGQTLDEIITFYTED